MNGKLLAECDDSARFRGVSIDSRTITPDALFFAIRGERHDGHRFIGPAVSSGAAGVVLSDVSVGGADDVSVPTILVSDTHISLIELAKWRLGQLSIPRVGVTGSVGKTTVKEMIGFLLRSAGLNTFVSQGNLNNMYGLPLSILSVDDENQCGVFELGVSQKGEMAQLAPILNPDVGVITNVSRAHTGSLGDVDSIRFEKSVLLDNLSGDSVAVVPADDSALLAIARERNVKTITFTAKEGVSADIVASNIVLSDDGNYSMRCDIDGATVTLSAFGIHQAHNAACAVAACRALGYDVDPAALEEFRPEQCGMRGDWLVFKGVRVCLDCYNASPASMESGVRSIAQTLSGNSQSSAVLALGDMLELGVISEEEHRRLADVIHSAFALDSGHPQLKAIALVGREVAHTAERLSELGWDDSKVFLCDSHKTAVDCLARVVESGDSLYFKASRGVALERVYQELRKRLEGEA